MAAYYLGLSRLELGDLDSADVQELLALHFAQMRGTSPPEACHVLPLDGLRVQLAIPGYRVEASDPELAEWILDLAAGTRPEELAARLQASLTPSGRR